MRPGLPHWVLNVICVLVIGFGLFLYFGLSDFNDPGRAMFYGWFVVAGLILLVILIWRLAQDHKMKAWPTAAGRVVSARTETRIRHFDGEPDRPYDVPVIEYTFKVGSKDYRGTRFDVADDGSNHVQEILDKYKSGTAVPVFYNPLNPVDCVLQRGAPQGMWMGCLYLIVILGAVLFALHWLWIVGTDAWLRFRPGSNPKLMIFSGLFGLFLFGAFISSKPKVPQDFDELKNGPWLLLLIALAILAISVHVGQVFG